MRVSLRFDSEYSAVRRKIGYLDPRTPGAGASTLWTPISNSGKNWRMKTVLVLIAFVLASIRVAEAQQPKKVHRVGVLSIAQSLTRLTAGSTVLKGLRDGLKEAGYVEGKNLVLDISPKENLRRAAFRCRAI